MSVLVLDAGNSIIKAKIARREKGEIAFPHALRKLTESEYQNIVSRASMNGNTKDYLRVNGIPYVAGESGERHGVLTQRSGLNLEEKHKICWIMCFLDYRVQFCSLFHERNLIKWSAKT